MRRLLLCNLKTLIWMQGGRGGDLLPASADAFLQY